MKKVVVAFSANSIAGREFLTGIFRYVNSDRDWNIQLLQGVDDITPEFIAKAIKTGVDGIITGFSEATPGYRALINSGIPLALNNFPPELMPEESEHIALLHNDDIAIGALAAQHFLEKGHFRSYAFVASADAHNWWTTFRQYGFRKKLAKHGIIPRTFRQKIDELPRWLKSLPKPTAIMTSSDQAGAQVLYACREARIKVPSQASVIGVDNDELICNKIRPTLSSIHPDHIKLAISAAQELDCIMHCKDRKSQTLYVPPLGIVERDSTHSVPPTGFLIQEGLAFIKEYATSGITVEDVAKHLHVSPSLLRLRFRTINGRSVKGEILSARMSAAETMLRTTSYSIEQIAHCVGFTSANWFTHAFSAKHGVSPSQWRKFP